MASHRRPAPEGTDLTSCLQTVAGWLAGVKAATCGAYNARGSAPPKTGEKDLAVRYTMAKLRAA